VKSRENLDFVKIWQEYQTLYVNIESTFYCCWQHHHKSVPFEWNGM